MASHSHRTEAEVVGINVPRHGKTTAEHYTHPGIEPLLDIDQVLNITKWSRSTLYNRIREDFPTPIHTGPRTRAWDPKKVRAYLAACRPRKRGRQTTDSDGMDEGTVIRSGYA